ncbi:LacI family DNA-binding transcriptional regulator [Paenibacillus sedimenti]|uniref:LacI family DNA-binding transcriptional regulator n=1 Tax=Paenibacillus sedimenti TaxID=2770274 RepID=A0A926KN66_9BACL|nr:LacI family DNA-binding transcriptional regulator [Paenibacillus sedimenti]MBD0380927.1 LacI family DNA-binding transcriptional regulator [Paenibacillus sedimenti]
MSATIKDIARICKVSEGTVDRALNARPGISKKTKEYILNVAKELNYTPNHLARGLAKGRSMTLGVILFDVRNPYFAQLMNAIEVKARELGYVVFPIFTHSDTQNERKALEHFKTRQVDGIIMFSVQSGHEFEKELLDLKIPIVTIGNRISGGWTYVGINERESMKDAVKHVVSQGYEEIIYICPPLTRRGEVNLYTLEERLAGCREGLSEMGKKEPLVIMDSDYIKAISQIDLESQPKKAVVCPADIYALEVLNHYKKNKIRVPEQIGLMGFDDIDTLKYISPRLCSVRYPVSEIGITAVNRLLEEINGNHNKHLNVLLLQHQIVTGESL